jgi:hypothetical protein
MEKNLKNEFKNLCRYRYYYQPYKLELHDLLAVFESLYTIDTVITDLPVDYLGDLWNGACWVAPNNGSDISNWMEKSYMSAFHNGATVVGLVPARTETTWWHNYCRYADVYFLQGRMKFGLEDMQPVPCAVVVFSPECLTREPQTTYLSMSNLDLDS